jgi:hypothetical protein
MTARVGLAYCPPRHARLLVDAQGTRMPAKGQADVGYGIRNIASIVATARDRRRDRRLPVKDDTPVDR